MIFWLGTQSKEARKWIEEAFPAEHRMETIDNAMWLIYCKVPKGVENPCVHVRDNIKALSNLAGNTYIGAMSFTGGFGDEHLHKKLVEWQKKFRSEDDGNDTADKDANPGDAAQEN